MRAIIQRVFHASVQQSSADCGQTPTNVNSIKKGLLVLLGIHRDDQEQDVEWLANKLLKIKLFDDRSTGTRWKLSVMEMDYEILCISQFTLYGVLKGNKPDFHYSMAGPESLPVYEKFLSRLGEVYKMDKIQKGFFGERMIISADFDGPVTITLDSPSTKKIPKELGDIKNGLDEDDSKES